MTSSSQAPAIGDQDLVQRFDYMTAELPADKRAILDTLAPLVRAARVRLTAMGAANRREAILTADPNCRDRNVARLDAALERVADGQTALCVQSFALASWSVSPQIRCARHGACLQPSIERRLQVAHASSGCMAALMFTSTMDWSPQSGNSARWLDWCVSQLFAGPCAGTASHRRRSPPTLASLRARVAPGRLDANR